MGRKTSYYVFVDKSELNDPDALFDAVISHLIKKGCDPVKRKRFLAQFMKVSMHDEKMRVLNEWVQVRDAATYPFRNKSRKEIAVEQAEQVEEKDEDYAFAGIADEAVEELNPREEDDQPSILDLVEEAADGEVAGDLVYKTTEERNADEDKGVEGGVPVDDGADGEPESGDASE